MPFETKQVDYNDHQDSQDLVRLLSEYASLETGDDNPDLSGLPKLLAGFPTAFSLLAYEDQDPAAAIGLVNCFFGFSTFYGRKLVNVHDVIVTKQHRGKGVGGALLDGVEKIAVEHDCCRLTLEVYADNAAALRAYEKQGFTRDPAKPNIDTFFLRKSLI
jgi:ribosomal protein S18 acetylase RimI-like enzyme